MSALHLHDKNMSIKTKENRIISSADMRYSECLVQLTCQSHSFAEMTRVRFFFTTPTNREDKKFALTAHVPIWLVLTVTNAAWLFCARAFAQTHMA